MHAAVSRSPLPSAPAAHVREHGSLLAAVEKRALVWTARRLPAWVSPDVLTFVGVTAMAGAGLAFALARVTTWSLALVPAFLALNWFGDSLDGTVARVRECQRPRYGFYLDHVVDMIGAVMLFAGLAFSGLISGWIAAMLLTAYLLVCGESFLATHTVGVFRLSFSGFGPTELRILLSLGALAAMRTPIVDPFGLGPARFFDVGGVFGIVGLAGAFVASAIRNTMALYRAEPLTGRITSAKSRSHSRAPLRGRPSGVSLASLGVPPRFAPSVAHGSSTELIQPGQPHWHRRS